MTFRLIIAAVFLAAALTGSILAFSSVQTVFDEMTVLADEALASQDSEFFEITEKMGKVWDEKGRVIEVILKHTDADTLEKYFLLLRTVSENKNRNAAEMLLEELKAFITVTAEGEKPEIQNIF